MFWCEMLSDSPGLVDFFLDLHEGQVKVFGYIFFFLRFGQAKKLNFFVPCGPPSIGSEDLFELSDKSNTTYFY